MRKLFALAVGLFVAGMATVPVNAAIKGDYVEVRSADVYTGPCFANGQVNLEGKQAMMAWKIRQGSWKGVSLDGLGVLVVVRASATLGDLYHNPYPAKSVVIVDSRANTAQRTALVAFAKSAAGRLAGDVVAVDAAPIKLERGSEHGSLTLVAGKLARIKTRSLCQGDAICGNEVTYYPPLTKAAHAMPAYTLEEAFNGKGLGEVWNLNDSRSAFVGTFSL